MVLVDLGQDGTQSSKERVVQCFKVLICRRVCTGVIEADGLLEGNEHVEREILEGCSPSNQYLPASVIDEFPRLVHGYAQVNQSLNDDLFLIDGHYPTAQALHFGDPAQQFLRRIAVQADCNWEI